MNEVLCTFCMAYSFEQVVHHHRPHLLLRFQKLLSFLSFFILTPEGFIHSPFSGILLTNQPATQENVHLLLLYLHPSINLHLPSCHLPFQENSLLISITSYFPSFPAFYERTCLLLPIIIIYLSFLFRK